MNKDKLSGWALILVSCASVLGTLPLVIKSHPGIDIIVSGAVTGIYLAVAIQIGSYLIAKGDKK